MIAEKLNICTITRYSVKKFIAPSLRPLRALFFILPLFTTGIAVSQNTRVHSLINGWMSIPTMILPVYTRCIRSAIF